MDWSASDGRRRVTDALAELDFVLVQLITLHSDAGAHHSRDQHLRIAALHRRADYLEHRLRRRAAELGEDDRATLGHLRRLLREQPDRRRGGDRSYRGPERRTRVRRAG
jgi:hypothetical protein